jgi:ADP-dependent phosphofructokinase/glucokinase
VGELKRLPDRRQELLSFMQTQEEIDQLADAIYRDKVLRARAEEPGQKLIDGIRLFESALAFTRAGVAAELRTSDEEAISKGVQRRFDIVRRMEEHGIYSPVTARS